MTACVDSETAFFLFPSCFCCRRCCHSSLTHSLTDSDSRRCSFVRSFIYSLSFCRSVVLRPFVLLPSSFLPFLRCGFVVCVDVLVALGNGDLLTYVLTYLHTTPTFGAGLVLSMGCHTTTHGRQRINERTWVELADSCEPTTNGSLVCSRGANRVAVRKVKRHACSLAWS